MSNKSNHPYAPFIPEGATKLIIGTIPPQRFCLNIKNLQENDVDFYYGSQDNYFWRIVSQILDAKLLFENTQDAINERKKILADNNIGITDIIESCIHVNSSSSDKDLADIKFKDVKSLLTAYPRIDTLIYTSELIKSFVYRSTQAYHTTVNNDKRSLRINFNDKD